MGCARAPRPVATDPGARSPAFDHPPRKICAPVAATLLLALLLPGLHDLGAIPLLVGVDIAILSVAWRVKGVES